MSWSVTLIGKPEAIALELERHSGTLNGQCKVEFDAAMPHLTALLRENFNKEPTDYNPPIMRLSASGSGYSKNDVQMTRSCTATLENVSGRIVETPREAGATA